MQEKHRICKTRSIKKIACLGCLALFLTACASTRPAIDSDDQTFQHDISSPQKPWTGQAFDAGEDKFTFAVFSDLTGGERERIFEIAIAQLNLLRPEFIINVGDLIEGASDRVELDRQWDSFDQRAGRARAPVFYVGGNHDLLGPVMQQAWRDRYGQTYFHFVYRDVLFLVLDTEDHSEDRLQEIANLRWQAVEIAETQGWDAFSETEYARLPENRGGNISIEQSVSMQQAIRDNPDVRWTFLLMHKAPWLRSDMSSFAEIEAALADRPYTVFHGHEHVYHYEQRQGRDYIQLATTGGVQMPDKGRSMDQVVLVTVDSQGVNIANLLMSGILDKTGRIPQRGDDLCFEAALCDEED